ncbi:hypothetical protein HK405_000151 [Cladochytrium tenue]|nr:hypothetical protein HK405_000151 [Cladochytrium tenue]
MKVSGFATTHQQLASWFAGALLGVAVAALHETGGVSAGGTLGRAIDASFCKHGASTKLCKVVGPSGSSGVQFTTIQSAVESLDDATPATLVVLAGTYHEQVNVTRTGPLYLYGETRDRTDPASNLVQVTWSAHAQGDSNLTDNVYTSVLTVAPNLNASLTGSGPTGYPVLADNPFGCRDFRAHNLDFLNTVAETAVGPALTLNTGYANASFYQCGFYSYQDTIYVGKLSNAYFRDCIVAGETDFLYGFGTAWFERSVLQLRSCGGGVTAWKGTNTTFTNAYGVYVHQSRVERANSSLAIEDKCALGRPWNSLHRSVFADTYLDDSILPAGYIKWSTSDPRYSDELTTMAEYRTYGPGFNETARVAGGIDKLLTDEEYLPYSSPSRVFKFPFSDVEGNTAWIEEDW